jgi:hypothetical protein
MTEEQSENASLPLNTVENLNDKIKVSFEVEAEKLNQFREKLEKTSTQTLKATSETILRKVSERLRNSSQQHEQSLSLAAEKQRSEFERTLTLQASVIMFVFISTFLALFAIFMLWGLNLAIKNEVTEQLTHQQVFPKPDEVMTLPAPVTSPASPPKALQQAKP